MKTSSEKINVLHVIDKFSMDGVNPSSCSHLFLEWVPRFDPSRFNIFVCGLKRPEPAGRWLENQGIKVFYLHKGKFSLSSVSALIELIEREKIDLLHLHGYSSANFGRIAARKKGIPAIVHEHAILKVLPHQFVMDFLLRNKTDAAVAVSGAVKEFMSRGRSIPEDKITIISNGINLEQFQPAEAATVLAKKQELGIPPDYKVVGTITRLREEKGNQYLLEAAARVVRKFPNIKFVIVGDGPLRGELEVYAQQQGISNSVIFTGFCNNVPLMLSVFDIKVIASLREGFCLALLEAMAMGKAIVSTNVGGIPEIAEDGKTALLVPPADAGALAEKILELLYHEDKARQLAREAKVASQQYSIENNVRALEKLYLQLLNHV
ncbi:MAG: glycosyltransferase [candidate division KSB1 bacterium]|nr:glycosyltransferase [candidate division KSB1 bacterium]